MKGKIKELYRELAVLMLILYTVFIGYGGWTRNTPSAIIGFVCAGLSAYFAYKHDLI